MNIVVENYCFQEELFFIEKLYPESLSIYIY